jgi:ABC-type multidrug transport system ATPase subunit
MSVYEVVDLTKRYSGGPKPANDRVTLTVEAGEIFGILGDNGAGKSTLVRQMVNLIAPTSGVIRFQGRPIDADPLATAFDVGYMPQSALALNNMTVGEAIYFAGHLRGLSAHDARRERDDLLEQWELGALRHRSCQRLSGGQRRLVQLSVAVAGSPPVLLLDEPTNDLDPLRRRRVWEFLRRLNHEQGTTILFITHDAAEAEKIIQRVGVMHEGRLLAVGRPAELKRQIAQKLRLTVSCTPDLPPMMPADVTPLTMESGRWSALVDYGRAPAVLEQLHASNVEDYRLSSPSLEDLYFFYVAPS